jgi:hypothetical protein
MHSDKEGLRLSGSLTVCIAGTSHAFVWFGALWLDKAPGTQSFVTGTTKIIHADVAAAGAVKLQKKGAVRAVRQHASAFTERAVLFGQAAFVAFAWENRHFFNLEKLCIY